MRINWFLIALSFSLALSSCAKRQYDQNQGLASYGFGYCDGSIGSFDVYVIRNQQDPTLYTLSIIPASLSEPGDVVKVDIANQSPSYREVVHEVVLQPNQEIFAGTITDSDLQTYNILAITPFDGSGSSFLEQQSEKDALCTLPVPGDGTGG